MTPSARDPIVVTLVVLVLCGAGSGLVGLAGLGLARTYASPRLAADVAIVLPGITAAAAALFTCAGRVAVRSWRAPLFGATGCVVAGVFLLACAAMTIAAAVADRRHLEYPQVTFALLGQVAGGLFALRASRRAAGAVLAPRVRWPGALALSLVIGFQLAVPIAWRLGAARAERMQPEAPDVR